jgi:predicted AAA+ superfamily ATPase
MERRRHVAEVLGLLRRHRAVALLGARQVGKTTLGRTVARRFRGPSVVFDLEKPEDEARLADPSLALRGRRGLVVLDEIQRSPGILPVLRVLIDAPGAPRFLLLGSASPELVRGASETLAGRIVFHHLAGFALDEVGPESLDRLWLRGGFPRSYLARSTRESVEWRQGFITTFLERDLPQLGVQVPSATLRRFWSMLAHLHGQILNSSELARSFGVADTTIRRYLDLLAGTFVARLLPPWHENLAKRQVKSPMVYLSDSGLLHTLLGLPDRDAVESHPKVGASWEGFLLGQLVERLGARPEEVFFWATHAGAELDLLVVRGRLRLGFEIKRTSSPAVTPSMRTAVADLGLARLDVIHGGQDTFPLAPRIRGVAAHRLLEGIEPLG